MFKWTKYELLKRAIPNGLEPKEYEQEIKRVKDTLKNEKYLKLDILEKIDNISAITEALVLKTQYGAPDVKKEADERWEEFSRFYDRINSLATILGGQISALRDIISRMEE